MDAFPADHNYRAQDAAIEPRISSDHDKFLLGFGVSRRFGAIGDVPLAMLFDYRSEFVAATAGKTRAALLRTPFRTRRI